MITAPVLVDGWQMECCGTPPAEGARVSWTLQWRARYETLFDTGWSITAEVEPSSLVLPMPSPEESAEHSAIARVGGLSVFVTLPPPVPPRLELHGVLHEDHHVDIPEGAPSTTGTITRVRLVSLELALSEDDDAWVPVDGSAEFTDVVEAPRFLDFRPPPEGALRWRRTTDILVELQVEE